MTLIPFDRVLAAASAKLLQLCPTLCDPIDSSPPRSSVPGILQARIQEWVAIFFSNAWKWKVKMKSLNRVQLLVTPPTVAHHTPPSMGFSRQEYWSGLPFPSPWQSIGGSCFFLLRKKKPNWELYRSGVRNKDDANKIKLQNCPLHVHVCLEVWEDGFPRTWGPPR